MTYRALNMITSVNTDTETVKNIWQAVDWNVAVHVVSVSV
jgi:hypothetical protein